MQQIKAYTLTKLLYPFRFINDKWYSQYQYYREQIKPSGCTHTKSTTVWIYSNENKIKLKCANCKIVFYTPIYSNAR